MIGPKAMSREIEESDPISSAIGEFRDELLFWIDSELVRLRERVQVDDSVIEEELATAARNSNFSGSSGRARGESRRDPILNRGPCGRSRGLVSGPLIGRT